MQVDLLQAELTSLLSKDVPISIVGEIQAKFFEYRTRTHDTVHRMKREVEYAMRKELMQAFDPINITVDDLLFDAKSYLSSIASPKVEATLRVAYENTGIYVLADKEAISPVFVDLVKNATEAMDYSGNIDISVKPCSLGEIRTSQDTRVLNILQQRLRGTPLNRNAYRAVRVYNSGPQFAAETLEHLFEPGFTTKKDGHGVGLLTVASRVQDCRGFISFENCDEPKGVAFTLYLPTIELSDYITQLPLVEDPQMRKRATSHALSHEKPPTSSRSALMA